MKLASWYLFAEVRISLGGKISWRNSNRVLHQGAIINQGWHCGGLGGLGKTTFTFRRQKELD